MGILIPTLVFRRIFCQLNRTHPVFSLLNAAVLTVFTSSYQFQINSKQEPIACSFTSCQIDFSILTVAT